jgi:predicted nucleotidyltransferase
MLELSLDGISVGASSRIRPFLVEILDRFSEGLHSIYVTGSALTTDYNDKTSDINSLIVLNNLTFDFLRFLAPLGKKFGSKGVAAPILMTHNYIRESLDVFPMEFLELKMIHKTVYGEDILKDIDIDRALLRLQCEREIKTRLMGLRQGYVSLLGDSGKISRMLSSSIRGCVPLFRAVVYLKGIEPPIRKANVINSLSQITGIPGEAFAKALLLKEKNSADVLSLFEEYYANLEAVSAIINALEQ